VGNREDVNDIAYQTATTVAKATKIEDAATRKQEVIEEEFVPKLEEIKELSKMHLDDIANSGVYV